LGLAQAFLVSTAHGNGAEAEKADKRRAKSIADPLPTVAGNRGDWYVAQPFIIPIDHQSNQSGTKTPDDPLTTITTKQRHALIDSFLIQYYGSSTATPVTKPIPTITCNDRFALGEPRLVEDTALTELNKQRVISALFHWCDNVLAALSEVKEKKAKAHIRQPIFQVEQAGKILLIPLEILLRMLNWRELAAAQGFPKTYQFKGNSTQIVKMVGNAVPKNMAKALGRAALAVL
jgi:site-specific DNA-cytosine methylase